MTSAVYPMVWLNGALLSERDARLSIADRGFLLGDGIFETIRVRGGRPSRAAAHLARMRRGAAVLGLALPDIHWEAALTATLGANAMSDGVLRLTISRGPGPRGILPPAKVEPTILIVAAPIPDRTTPIRLVLARVTRRDEESPLAKIKSLNYLDNILARQEAARRGADDAVLLNTQGRVAETTVSTLYVLRNGRLLTPPVAEGALPGVARADILTAGLAEERPLTQADLDWAEGMFLSNSLGIQRVSHYENTALPENDPLLQRLIDVGEREGFGENPSAEV